jgi:eukaryotic-like serine/threonine-protein kinase
LIGQVVNYRYEILEKCGDGSFFTVYKARDKVLNRLVAVKILVPQYAANKDFAERVIAEAQASVALSNPNIAKVFEADHQEGLYFIALEYVRGINLKDKIRRLAPFSPAQAVDVAIAVAEALDSAHNQTMVHGDLRPQNVLVTSDSQVKVTDFGMAASVSTFPAIQTNTVLRSVHYMSPEVAEGKTARPTSDVYSLGVMMYEMLTGTVPFDGDTAIAVALRHAKDPPPSPRSLNSGIPKVVEAIVLKALQKLPEERYRTMQEMIQALRAVRQQLDAPQFIQKNEDTQSTEAIDMRVEEKEPPTFLGGALKIAFLLFALGLVGLVVMVLYLFLGVGSPSEVETPLLLGKTQTEAETIARNAGLELSPAGTQFNNEYPEGQIYETMPNASMRVRKGQSIRIWISRGSRFIKTPDVVEMTEDKARDEINGTGLTTGESVEVYSDTVPTGSVVKQSPSSGTQLERGRPVKLFVSMGKEPTAEPTNGQTPGAEGNTTNPPAASGDQRDLNVHVKIRADATGPQAVKITLDYGDGESTAYEANHRAGDDFIQVVQAGKQSVTIRTYVNDQLVDTSIK